jgi:hypothetical protein
VSYDEFRKTDPKLEIFASATADRGEYKIAAYVLAIEQFSRNIYCDVPIYVN